VLSSQHPGREPPRPSPPFHSPFAVSTISSRTVPPMSGRLSRVSVTHGSARTAATALAAQRLYSTARLASARLNPPGAARSARARNSSGDGDSPGTGSATIRWSYMARRARRLSMSEEVVRTNEARRALEPALVNDHDHVLFHQIRRRPSALRREQHLDAGNSKLLEYVAEESPGHAAPPVTCSAKGCSGGAAGMAYFRRLLNARFRLMAADLQRLQQVPRLRAVQPH
jgi:hypothetical protein